MRINKTAALSPDGATESAITVPARWICGPVLDRAMTFSWVPFALLAMANLDNPGNLKTLMFYVFLFSFMHQPLSLFLVYGDRERFALRRNVFIWSPLIFLISNERQSGSSGEPFDL